MVQWMCLVLEFFPVKSIGERKLLKEKKMLNVAVYESDSEVVIFAVNEAGEHLKVEEYFFQESGRDKDDYNISIMALPLQIQSDLRVDS